MAGSAASPGVSVDLSSSAQVGLSRNFRSLPASALGASPHVAQFRRTSRRPASRLGLGHAWVSQSDQIQNFGI